MTIPAPEEVRYVGAELCREILSHAADRRDTLRQRVDFWFPGLSTPEKYAVVEQLLTTIEHTANLIQIRQLNMTETGRMRRPQREGGTPRAQD